MSTPIAEDNSTSRRPKDTKFKQQKLPAWQPVMTAGSVLPAFFAIGIAFIPLGIALLVTSDNVQEHIIDYTHCKPANEEFTCADFVQNISNTGEFCHCSVEFELKEDFRGTVYLYYGLTNYYQNHRRYVKSRDDNQLVGNQLDGNQLSGDCRPYRAHNDSDIAIAPCGAIANSLFNDTFNVTYINSEQTEEQVPLLNKNIAWSTDRNTKFQNPDSDTGNLEDAFKGTTNPPNWHKKVYELDLEDANNNGYENEDFIVWMRTAALPTFRKLYRRIDHSGSFNMGLPKGNYILDIDYAYPVTSFDGTKRMVLTSTSWLGGKNPFLGIAYLVVGSICIVLGVVFLVIHLKVGKNDDEDEDTEVANEYFSHSGPRSDSQQLVASGYDTEREQPNSLLTSNHTPEPRAGPTPEPSAEPTEEIEMTSGHWM